VLPEAITLNFALDALSPAISQANWASPSMRFLSSSGALLGERWYRPSTMKKSTSPHPKRKKAPGLPSAPAGGFAQTRFQLISDRSLPLAVPSESFGP